MIRVYNYWKALDDLYHVFNLSHNLDDFSDFKFYESVVFFCLIETLAEKHNKLHRNAWKDNFIICEIFLNMIDHDDETSLFECI